MWIHDLMDSLSIYKLMICFYKDILPKTHSSHLKIVFPRKETSFSTIHFQVRAVSFREGT